MATRSEIEAAAKRLSTEQLAKRIDVANANCTQWTNDLRKLEEEESSIWDFLGGGEESDAVTSARKWKEEWCLTRQIYSAEMNRRRQAEPEATAKAEAAGYAERAKQREEVRRSAEATKESLAEREEFLGKETSIGGVILGIPQRIADSILSTVGLGGSQTAGERVLGLVRLVIAVAGAVALFFVARAILRGGMGFAERGAERTTAALPMIAKLTPASGIGSVAGAASKAHPLDWPKGAP